VNWEKTNSDSFVFPPVQFFYDLPSCEPFTRLLTLRLIFEAAINSLKYVNKIFSGERWKQKMLEKINKGTRLFQEQISSCSSVGEIMDIKFGIIDFSSHVSYLDGLTVPAEFSMLQGTLQEGILSKIYTQLLRIDPLSRRFHFFIYYSRESFNLIEIF
jgi:hypothetical protein